MTWHEVQSRLLDVQKEQQMCVHKQELTQLGTHVGAAASRRH